MFKFRMLHTNEKPYQRRNYCSVSGLAFIGRAVACTFRNFTSKKLVRSDGASGARKEISRYVGPPERRYPHSQLEVGLRGCRRATATDNTRQSQTGCSPEEPAYPGLEPGETGSPISLWKARRATSRRVARRTPGRVVHYNIHPETGSRAGMGNHR